MEQILCVKKKKQPGGKRLDYKFPLVKFCYLNFFSGLESNCSYQHFIIVLFCLVIAINDLQKRRKKGIKTEERNS